MKIYKSEINYFVTYPIIILLSAIFIYDIYIRNWFGIIMYGVFLTYCVSAVIDTTYQIKNEVLVIKSGLAIREIISIKKINKIKAVKNFISAPALTLDKLEVHYNTFDIKYISPKDKKNFIAELEKINPDIIIENNSASW